MRKTAVKKLKAANVPESSIIKVTGHNTTKGLTSYDPGDENEFRSMSNALNAPSSAQSLRNVNQVYQSSYQSSLNVQNVQIPQNVFHGCTVNFNTIQNVVKRKRVIIESDSSQSQD